MPETPGWMSDGFCTCGDSMCDCICCGLSSHCGCPNPVDAQSFGWDEEVQAYRWFAPDNWKPEPLTPAAFLAETLPDFARTQRLRALLTEVTAHEDHILDRMRQDGLLLDKARSLRERLTKSLETALSPLSSTETAQNAPGVGKDTPEFPSLQRAAQAFAHWPLSKPGPY